MNILKISKQLTGSKRLNHSFLVFGKVGIGNYFFHLFYMSVRMGTNKQDHLVRVIRTNLNFNCASLSLPAVLMAKSSDAFKKFMADFLSFLEMVDWSILNEANAINDISMKNTFI